MSKEELKGVGFDISESVFEAVKNARDAGKRYKGKQISNRIIFEIGARAFLGIWDESKEIIKQKIEDIETQEKILRSEKQLWLQQLEAIEAEEKKREEENLKDQQDRELLASKIIEYWEQITVFKKKEYIRYILNALPEKLSQEKVADVFPDEIAPIPTPEEALRIATDLLRGDCDE